MPATTANSATNAAQLTATSGRCTHLRADGKRCADAVYPGHTGLCHHHLRQQMGGISDGNSIAADILSSVGNFQSASAINVALGKLLVHQLTGRISRRDALAIAYTFQLLLQTLKSVKSELVECGYDHWWKSETSRILSGPSDLDELTYATLLPPSTQPLHPPAFDSETNVSPVPPTPAPASAPPACGVGVNAVPDPGAGCKAVSGENTNGRRAELNAESIQVTTVRNGAQQDPSTAQPPASACFGRDV